MPIVKSLLDFKTFHVIAKWYYKLQGSLVSPVYDLGTRKYSDISEWMLGLLNQNPLMGCCSIVPTGQDRQ